MNRILILVMLCVASASCVELENICSSDTFEYNDVLVNAFYRVQRNVTLQPLSYYLINDTVKCVLDEFKNQSNFWEANRIKHSYNQKFVELYTEELIGLPSEQYKKKRVGIHKAGWGRLFRMKDEEVDANCVASFEETAYSGYAIFELFDDLFTHNKYPQDDAGCKPTNLETFNVLGKLFDQLKASTDGQTFAFGPDLLDVFYSKQVVLPTEFKFLKDSSDRIRPETKSRFIFDLLLPFNNQNHKEANCVPAKDLPLFYKNKGGK